MEDIKFLLNQVKQATDYQINKKNLREKILIDLHIPYNNGLFLLSKELIAFVATWHEEELFLDDVYLNPILVNRTEFLTLCRQHYHSIMNDWYIKHNEIKSIRSI
jgi:hypothetical protein